MHPIGYILLSKTPRINTKALCLLRMKPHQKGQVLLSRKRKLDTHRQIYASDQSFHTQNIERNSRHCTKKDPGSKTFPGDILPFTENGYFPPRPCLQNVETHFLSQKMSHEPLAELSTSEEGVSSSGKLTFSRFRRNDSREIKHQEKNEVEPHSTGLSTKNISPHDPKKRKKNPNTKSGLPRGKVHRELFSDEIVMAQLISKLYPLDPSWNSRYPLKFWRGVTCTEDEGKVIAIDWSMMGLKGTLDFSLLPTELQRLRLDHNRLHGPLSLRNLPPHLCSLWIQYNNFTGYLDLSFLPLSLSSLSVAHNQLEGFPTLKKIPPKMQFLDLSYNDFEGHVADMCYTKRLNSSQTQLRRLDLRGNKFFNSMNVEPSCADQVLVV